MPTTRVYKSYNHFLKRTNPTENGVSIEFARRYPSYDLMNHSNKGCWNCYDSKYCIDSSELRNCIRAFESFDCSDSIDLTKCTLVFSSYSLDNSETYFKNKAIDFNPSIPSFIKGGLKNLKASSTTMEVIGSLVGNYSTVFNETGLSSEALILFISRSNIETKPLHLNDLFLLPDDRYRILTECST